MIDISRLNGDSEPGPYRWLYFAPPQFNRLPVEHQDQFLFLDDESTRHVYDVFNSIDPLCGDDGWGNKVFTGDCYRSVDRYQITSDDKALKKWLYRSGLPFKTQVLLLPVFKAESTPAILTTWKMVSKYADEFFSSDNLVIVDDTLKWCLYYHHDGQLSLARGRDFNATAD